MALAHFFSAAFVGLDAVLVEVEVHTALASGEDGSSLHVVGLPDAAAREAKDRVIPAIRNSKFEIKDARCVVNLAPGDLRKEGPLYDLPIAMGALSALQKLDITHVQKQYLIVGELGLSGEVRPIHGALPIAMLARQLGKKGIIVPAANAREAAAVPNLDVIAVSHLREAMEFLTKPSSIQPVSVDLSADLFKQEEALVDFLDVKGQGHVKRALEIAAAGAHNVLMSGAPGSGKTLMAKAMAGIIPELTVDEALETTKIHSVAGLLSDGRSLITQRPFRAPHHTVSYAGLIGGGTYPRPGEVALAHNGILFLDELPEFPRMVLEVLRQPLEDRKVTISRANGNYTFPTSFICIAAMNPCPCGMLGHPDKPCVCTEHQIKRYKSKISGPLKDRLDMHIDVPALRYTDLAQVSGGESSATIRERVKGARLRQKNRFGSAKTNSQMSTKDVKTYCSLNSQCHSILQHAVDVMGLSARGCDRMLRVARTIADLEGSEVMTHEHLMEAVSYRDLVIPR